MRISKSIINKIITIILIILPILEEYTISGMPGTAADIVMLMVVGIYLCDLLIGGKIKNKEINSEFGIFVICIVANYVISLIVERIGFGNTIDYLRLSLIYLTVILLFRKYVDYKIAILTLKIVGLLNCIYAIIQYVGIVIIGVYVPSYLPFFQHRTDLDIEEAYLEYASFYRPHSIFAEPAHFAEYILLYLFIVMWKNNKTKVDLILEIFITGCLFLTGSSTAIVGAVLVWLLLVIKLVKENNLKLDGIKMLIMIFVGAVAIKVVSSSSTLSIFITRFLVDKSSISGRMDNVGFYNDMSIYELIFGNGYNYDYMVENVGWLPGFSLLLWNLGIIALIIYTLALIKVYISNKKNKWAFSLLLIFCVLNVVTEIGFSYFCIPYFLIIMSSEQEEKKC